MRTRLLRWLAILTMDAGGIVVLLGVLGLLKASFTGQFANVIPTFASPPAALLAGAAAVVVGAVARRRVDRSSLSSARTEDELSSTPQNRLEGRV